MSSILQKYPEKSLGLVFDSLTDCILSVGSSASYRFVREAIEWLSDPRVTSLFLLEPLAHEANEVIGIRSLFARQIAFGKEGLVLRKTCISGKNSPSCLGFSSSEAVHALHRLE